MNVRSIIRVANNLSQQPPGLSGALPQSFVIRRSAAAQVFDAYAGQGEPDLLAQQLDQRTVRWFLDPPLEHLAALESLRILSEGDLEVSTIA
jgi:hypothetical protein